MAIQYFRFYYPPLKEKNVVVEEEDPVEVEEVVLDVVNPIGIRIIFKPMGWFDVVYHKRYFLRNTTFMVGGFALAAYSLHSAYPQHKHLIAITFNSLSIIYMWELISLLWNQHRGVALAVIALGIPCIQSMSFYLAE